MKNIYASLDIGSSTIKLVVGELINSNINVLFAKMIPAHGIKRGKIVDEAVVSQDVLSIIKEAENELGTEIKNVLLNIPTIHTKLYQSQGSTTINSATKTIAREDIVRALNLATQFKISDKEAIVSVIPVTFYYGEYKSKETPIGKISNSLHVDALVIATKKQLLYSYIRCVERAGVSVLDISIDAYSYAKEAFDAVYLQEGAILIDIGYKTTKISFFEEGFLKFLTTIPIGGHSLTKKISKSWQIPMSKAETYKIKYGTCNTLLSDEDIIHMAKKDDKIINYTQKDLSELLVQGVEMMMNLVKDQLMAIDNGRSYEVIIVGGGGEIEKIDEVSSRVLEVPVRVYRPQTIGARNMTYTANLGLIYYLADRKELIGEQQPSLVFGDVTNTMTLRLKGLTKTSPNNKQQHNSKLSRVLDVLFSDEE